MRKLIVACAALAAAFVVMSSGAEAKHKKTSVVVTPSPYFWAWNWPWSVKDAKLSLSNLIVSATATAAYFGIKDGNSVLNSTTPAYLVTTVGCAAVAPIVGTIVVDRPLTQREVFVSTGNCVVPFAGGWLMNAWFDANPQFEAKKKKK